MSESCPIPNCDIPSPGEHEHGSANVQQMQVQLELLNPDPEITTIRQEILHLLENHEWEEEIVEQAEAPGPLVREELHQLEDSGTVESRDFVFKRSWSKPEPEPEPDDSEQEIDAKSVADQIIQQSDILGPSDVDVGDGDYFLDLDRCR